MPVDWPRLKAHARQSMLTGIAITVPLIVTIVILSVVVSFVFQQLDPVVTALDGAVPAGVPGGLLVLKITTVCLLFGVIFLIGFVAETRSGNGRIEKTFDQTMTQIPGIGSVYASFNEMSDMLLDTDAQSFREVKLVEYPTRESYTLAFVTASTPEHICETVDGENLQTLFLPMAQNPVIGGFVIHVEEDRIYDVDLSVQEGMQAIVTSGVTVGTEDADVLARTATTSGGIEQEEYTDISTNE